MQAWHDGGQVGQRPASVQKSRYRRVRTAPSGARTEWPLCGPHKHQWEAHDMQARRI